MPGSEQSILPPFNESDLIRETALIFIDSREDREVLRQAGRILRDLSIEASLGGANGESMTRNEMRAAQADLRHLQGYLAQVRREADESTLAPEDDELAHFAGKVAGKLGALVQKIEERLS